MPQPQQFAQTSPTGVTRRRAVVGAGLALGFAGVAGSASAASASKLASKSQAALTQLYNAHPRARELGAKSQAVLVFPEIIKAGALIGGQTGEGALLTKGRATAFYRTSSGSYGLQLGAQKYALALFFITNSSLDYLKKSNGWSVGSGPSVVMVDEGFAKTMNTTTLSQDVYAMIFGQKGLMAGVGIEGSKITQIYPDP
jgi:lipid-binding SYLF domain-containing protein